MMVVVSKDIVKPASNQNMYSVFRYSSFSDEVKSIYSHQKRSFGSRKVRFERGLEFFVVKKKGRFVSYFWLVKPEKNRFIDECAINVQLTKDAVWLRDIYVAENERGKNHFGNILNQVIEKYYPHIEKIYSDFEVSNYPSFKAHEKYGFRSVGRLNSILLFKKILIRKIDKLEKMVITGYNQSKPIIVIDEEYKIYKEANLG